MGQRISGAVLAVCLVFLPPAALADQPAAAAPASVVADTANTLQWRMRAEKGDAEAQYNLGMLYLTGVGAPQDFNEAIKWIKQAAEQGYGEAQNILGSAYYSGAGVEQSYLDAHMWFNLAAAQGVADAGTQRDLTAQHLTAEDIAKAQEMAQAWLASHTTK